jgi:nucleotide-binding universal stress UspA family protein
MIGPDFEKWEREFREDLDNAGAKLRENGVRSNVKLVDHTDIARAISGEAEEGSYDLIVVGNRGFGKLKSLLLGSVASGVANSAKTNLLIVR